MPAVGPKTGSDVRCRERSVERERERDRDCDAARGGDGALE